MIMVGVTIPAGLSGRTWQVITQRPARIVWRGSRTPRVPRAPHPGASGDAGVAVVRSGWVCRGDWPVQGAPKEPTNPPG